MTLTTHHVSSTVGLSPISLFSDDCTEPLKFMMMIMIKIILQLKKLFFMWCASGDVCKCEWFEEEDAVRSGNVFFTFEDRV